MKMKQTLPQQLSLFSDKDFDKVKTEELPDDGYDHTELFNRLAESNFRSKFFLNKDDKAYIKAKGLPTIRRHAADFIAERLAPAIIPNDGSQTPMKHVHPVFQAQHATGCCCRGCFEKWHHIPKGRELTLEEQKYAVSVIMEWIKRNM